MLYPDLHEDTIAPKNKMEEYLWACDPSEEAYVVAYVSKMFAVPTKSLPEKKQKGMTAEEMRQRGREARENRAAATEEATLAGTPFPESSSQNENITVERASEEPTAGPENPQEEETLLGFARLYSGTFHLNSTIACVLPKYNNSLPPTHPANKRFILTTQVQGLYIMMGRELVPVETVSAGNVFAIAGLCGKVWRSATICAPGGVKGVEEIREESKEWVLNLGGIIRQVG